MNREFDEKESITFHNYQHIEICARTAYYSNKDEDSENALNLYSRVLDDYPSNAKVQLSYGVFLLARTEEFQLIASVASKIAKLK